MSQPLTTEQLVHLAYILREEEKTLDGQIAEVEAKIIALGEGKHSGSDPDQVCTVINAILGHAGKVTYSLTVKAEKLSAAEFAAKQTALEKQARDLAGDEFQNLFDRHVLFTPTEGFPLLAPKLLTPARSEKLIALCAREGKPYSGKRAEVRYA